MKLSEHVDTIRNLIEGAFEKQMASLGYGKASQRDAESLPESLLAKRGRFEEMLANHLGETGNYAKAREKLVDELTFTLFNRLAAIKVMEAAQFFPPILTRQAEHGGRSAGHKAWLESLPGRREAELEGLREYFKDAFNELGKALPLYHRTYPYALLPDAISLNAIVEAFNAVAEDNQVEAGLWQSDDVLGWLYESYNNAKKAAFKDSKKETEYDKVSLQSQVYTPRWVVQFLVENSLGKLYLEMYPDSAIKNRHKIANAPAVRTRDPKPLHEIRLIDPACGSGNFLLYAFCFLYALYLDQIENYGADYDEDEIPRLIIENNLHGIDLDDRAIQLAQLGLYITARKKCRTINNLRFNIVSSDFYLPDYEMVREIFEDGNQLDKGQKELIADIWNDVKLAYKFGSLIQLDQKLRAKLRNLEAIHSPGNEDMFVKAEMEAHRDFAHDFFDKLKAAAEQHARSANNTFLSSKTGDAVTFLELLSKPYDVATANPPYTDRADFGPELATFIEANYSNPDKFHTNLYATFIKRCYDLTGPEGFVAMVHPPTFMYIKTFEGVRKFIIQNTHINLFVEWGYLGMFNPSARVDSAVYVLEKKTANRDSIFIKLDNLYETKRYEALIDAYACLLSGKTHELLFAIPQPKLKIIKSWPFIYWISDEFRKKFESKSVDEELNVRSGITTSNNLRCVRFHWEVLRSSISKEVGDNRKWVGYAKGGPFQKWVGNDWLVIDFSPSGFDFLSTHGNHLPSREFYFLEGITYSASGSKGASFRFLPGNRLFDTGGSSIFPRKYGNIPYSIAVLNSKLAFYVSYCFNPTVNTQGGDLKRIPFVVPDEALESRIASRSKGCMEIINFINQYSIVDRNFSHSPLEKYSNTSPNISVRIWNEFETRLHTQILINEAIINEKIFEAYDLTVHDKAMVLAKEGESIGGFPVCFEARSAYLSDDSATKEFPLDDIREFIEALPTRSFTDEERKVIESGFPTLFQSNNDLEEFCIRHQINPINVWYWFRESGVVPKQRQQTLAMEFLADLIREILMEDEDGIIPLVPNAGQKVILERLERKFIEKGFTMAQFSSFDSLLGRPLEDYLNEHFFAELSDHLNLFMHLPKTPFIWHLTSGPERGFDCYLIIYKWSRDRLLRLKSFYLEHRVRALENRRTDLADNESAVAQTEKDRIGKQLREIATFESKIDSLLADGYDPVLDDGVGKNIAPLQKLGMLPCEVLNPGQLKKYLNADW
jgi:type I restriction-modification system DNA methylase subunit